MPKIRCKRQFKLERDGSIVGGVRCNDAFSVSHVITGNIQLTHLSKAARNERKTESDMCNIRY